MVVDDAARKAYLEAYEAWQKQLQALHAVLLDGKKLDTPHFVALLRRESQAKARYDEARRRLLGLPDGGE